MNTDNQRAYFNHLFMQELDAAWRRPPLGLKPWWLAAEQRIAAIEAAALRYTNAHLDVPRSWLRERRLLKWALRLAGRS